MTRTLLTVVAVLLAAAWADGQTAPRLAADQVRLLHANHALLEDLVDHGVKLSNAAGTLDHAAECRRAVATLGHALAAAADDPHADPSRIAELTDQVADLVRDGLTPTLAAARAQIRAGSPGAEKLVGIETAAAADLAGCRQAVPADGRVGRADAVRRARARLDAAGTGLSEPRP